MTDKGTSGVLIYRQGAGTKEEEINWEEVIKNKETNEIQGWKIVRQENLGQSHLYVLTDFQPSSVYYFRVAGVDKRGNVTISDEHSMLTPAKQESVFDMIVSKFIDIFGWIKTI